jgi:hypothetical protein
MARLKEVTMAKPKKTGKRNKVPAPGKGRKRGTVPAGAHTGRLNKPAQPYQGMAKAKGPARMPAG